MPDRIAGTEDRRLPVHPNPLHRIWNVIADCPTHPLEVLGGASAMGRGAWMVLFPTEAHQAPGIAEYLEALLPIAAWGVLMFFAGLLQLFAVATDDLQLRKLACYVLVFLVGVMLAGYLWYAPGSIGVPLYATMFIKHFWVGMRSRNPATFTRTRVTRQPISPVSHAGG
jgi:hypothetical protein